MENYYFCLAHVKKRPQLQKYNSSQIWDTGSHMYVSKQCYPIEISR